MANQIFRVGKDIYDATTGTKIANPQQLATQYKGATEVGGPTSNVDTSIAGSTPSAIVRPGQYGLSDWRSYQAVKDAANEIIKIRTQGNKDITDPTTYWKQKIKSGGEVTPAMREMSPADQADVRLSQQSMAGGALDALDAERASREKIAGNTISNLKDIYESQRQSKVDEADKAYKEAMLEIERYNAGLGNGGGGNSTGKGVIVDPTGNAYDISSYATDVKHEQGVRNILSGIPQLRTIADIDNYLYSKAKTTPITGQMIANSAAKYGVSWEAMIAMMQQDSSLGTAGKAIRTNNPGNVGNTTEGGTRKFDTVDEGVDAVAKWLSQHKTTQPTNTSGVKNNNLKQDEMKQVAYETGIDLAEIPAMTNQQIIDARRSAKATGTTTSDQDLADTLEGKKIQSLYGLTPTDISAVLQYKRSGMLTDAEIKNYLVSIGKKADAYDAIQMLITPSN